tara:strand:- start:29393 stop:30640 length:1248 start_codon:yes stop_codon:yes gene_type:complete
MNKSYDWVIVGGGITGIAIAEILCRSGKKVKLLERNATLSSETTREFHEWVHTGSLYTLKGNQKITQKTMLGAIDDLFTYYSSFKSMNLKQMSSGISINDNNEKKKWYNNENLHFKYRIKGRKTNLFWILRIAKSILYIDKVKKYNWLRNRGGELKHNLSIISVLVELFKLIKFKQKLYTIKSTDFTSNSRIILNDLLQNALHRGLEISFKNKFTGYKKKVNEILVECESENLITKNLVLCNGKEIANFFTSNIKTSYAPMLVTKNVPESQKPYVELDIKENNCINYIGKENNVGLMGGISFDSKKNCDSYFNYLASKLKSMWPNSEVLERYVGEKHEIIPNESSRNYQFFIWNKKDTNIWAVIPGKFSLFSSFATEFYRRAYNENPEKTIIDYSDNNVKKNIISDTIWSNYKDK